MSDSENKKKPCRPAPQPRAAATKPGRPSSSPLTQPTVAKPCRPASLPTAAVAKPRRPSAPAPVQTTGRPPNRPSAEPVRAYPSRMERPYEAARAQPRAVVRRPYASTPPKPRVGTSVGSFGALAAVVFPTFEERAEESGCVRVAASPAKDGDVPIACITALYKEPRYFSGAKVTFASGPRPTNAQIQAFRNQGYSYSRSLEKLGDVSGHRTVAYCDSDGTLLIEEVQAEVPINWFMSSETPAWKARAVPTEQIGQGSVHADADRAEESFKAIFDGPSAELVTKLHAARWPKYFVDQRGTEATAAFLADELWDAIAVEEFRKADRRLEYAFAIGETRFARLWNLALSVGANAAKPRPTTAEDAIVVPAALVSDVSPTS